MASVSIAFDFSRYSERLYEIDKNLENLDVAMEHAAEYLVRSVVNRILRSKRGPDKRRWEPLTEDTVARKGHDRILFDSGNLARSIEVDNADRDGFTISAHADYAAYMQFGVRRTGGAINGKSIPPRPFMGFSEANKRSVAKLLAGYIERGETRAYGEVE